MELVSVAAIGDDLAVGRDGELPWGSLPEDERQYRARVADAPVIPGRRTFESMLDEPPGAAQIVLSRSEPSFDVETATAVGSLEAAIEAAESLGAGTAYVLGGAEVFRLFQPHLYRMVLSRVPGEYEADAFYPDWDEDEWRLARPTEHDGVHRRGVGAPPRVSRSMGAEGSTLARADQNTSRSRIAFSEV